MKNKLNSQLDVLQIIANDICRLYKGFKRVGESGADAYNKGNEHIKSARDERSLKIIFN